MTAPEPAVPGTRWLIEITAEAEVIPAATRIVGERGPEPVDLPSGSTIHPSVDVPEEEGDAT